VRSEDCAWLPASPDAAELAEPTEPDEPDDPDEPAEPDEPAPDWLCVVDRTVAAALPDEAVDVLAPIDPLPAITPQVSAKVARLAAATPRRTLVLRRARASRGATASRSVGAASLSGMRAT